MASASEESSPMVVLRCTQKLLVRLKRTAVSADTESTTLLGDWYGNIAFGKTRNRSLLGTLNDFAFMAQQGTGRRQAPESLEDLMRFLSRTPILPLDGANPAALTRAAFSNRSCR
jgi:hypothetical protein